MRVAGHKWLGRRMGAGCRYFCGFALGWNECGGERRGRRGNTGANAKGAEVTQKSQKGIPKLFGKGLNQCLCGLQGINGWEGAWGLVVGGFYGFALRRLEGYGATTQKAQRLRRSRRRDTKLFEKACKQYPCGLQAKNGWEGAWMLVVGVLPLIVATPCACLAAGAARGRRVRRRGLDAGAADFLPVYFLQFAAHDWLAAYGAGLRGFHFGFGWQLGGYFGDGK